MQLIDLYNANMRDDLVSCVGSIDLAGCSLEELISLGSWVHEVKEHADLLTLEDEIVGYTYDNLAALIPKVKKEEAKRGVQLVKSYRQYRS